MVIKGTASGISAGIMISIGGAVFLACDNRYAGALLFTVALLSICYKGYALFTGKVGDIVEKHKKADVSELLLALLGNAIGTILCGYLIRFAMPSIGDAAQTLCEGKLTQAIFSTFVRGIFCGVLMYIAVSVFRERGTVVGILFCIPVFILAGFEHSIADMFYFAASGIVSAKAALFIWLVIAGNSVGACILPALGLLGNSERKNT